MIKKNYFFTLVLFCSFMSTAQEQSSINAGKGEIASSDMTMAYSIGQVFYNFVSDAQWTLISGIQQEHELYVDTKNSDIDFGIEISLYPNPASDYVKLSFPESESPFYDIILFDSSAKEIRRYNVMSYTVHLSVRELNSGTYILHIEKEGRIVCILKLIKQ